MWHLMWSGKCLLSPSDCLLAEVPDLSARQREKDLFLPGEAELRHANPSSPTLSSCIVDVVLQKILGVFNYNQQRSLNIPKTGHIILYI